MSQTGELGMRPALNSPQKVSRPQVLFVHRRRRGNRRLEVLSVVMMVAVVYYGVGFRTRSRRVL
jgi:hypothetical protein